MVAFTATTLLMLAMIAGGLWYARRRPQGTPVTWGEAMLASVYVFMVMFLAYGVVPHQWLVWADNELNWRADRLLLTSGDPIIRWDWFPNDWWAISDVNRIPMNISYLVIRDIIVTGIYVVLLGVNIWLWSVWQKRGQAADKPAEVTSAYGRPLVKRA